MRGPIADRRASGGGEGSSGSDRLATGRPSHGVDDPGQRHRTVGRRGTAGPVRDDVARSVHYQHVIWVWMENKSSSDVIGSSQAPYINGLASECGLATKYHNLTHPSLPNYVGATSGLPLSSLNQFLSDCNPSRRCSTTASSIFSQGETWKAYEESMPSDCDKRNAGDYAVRHNPPPYFTSFPSASPRKRSAMVRRSATTCLTDSSPPIWRPILFPPSRSSRPTGSMTCTTAPLQKGTRGWPPTCRRFWTVPSTRAGHVAVMITWDEGQPESSVRRELRV